MNEEEEINDFEESTCSNVANLCTALSNLSEIDAEIMEVGDKKMFRRMKRKIFKALYYYCECLPEVKPENENT